MIDGFPDPYEEVKWPENWDIHKAPQHLEMAGALNFLLKMHPDEPWYGILIDRCRPRTKDWASLLIDQSKGGFANVKPLKHGDAKNPRLHVERMRCGVFDSRIINCVGWIYPPWCTHFFGDDVWEDVLHSAGLFRSTDVIVEEEQMEKGPRIHNGVPYWQRDANNYQMWLKSGAREKMIEKVTQSVL